MQRTRLKLSDSLWLVGPIGEKIFTIFRLKWRGMLPSTWSEGAYNSKTTSVVIRMDPDQLTVQRIVYTMLDYLGDIGGLYGTFNGFCIVMNLFLNFNGVYHLLTSSTYQVQSKISNLNLQNFNRQSSSGNANLSMLMQSIGKKLDEQMESSANIQEYKDVQWSFFSSLRLNMMLVMPDKFRCLCCKETTKDRLFKQGYKKLKKEVEIQTILKTLRVVKAAIKRDFT